MILKTGQKTIITTGEYSSYQIVGVFICLKDFEAECLKKHDTYTVEWSRSLMIDSHKFVSFLIKENYIEEIDGFTEWNINETCDGVEPYKDYLQSKKFEL